MIMKFDYDDILEFPDQYNDFGHIREETRNNVLRPSGSSQRAVQVAWNRCVKMTQVILDVMLTICNWENDSRPETLEARVAENRQ